MSHDYLVYDVFTDTPFGGNQLAVFPDARGIPGDRMMTICREFNYSEVTFVLPPQDPAHTARVRIFCPTREMAFAGHPTIGAAIALADLGRGPRMVLELGIGPLPCTTGPDGASFTNTAPLERLGQPDLALVAACLSLDPGQLRRDRHAPQIASVGNPFLLVELPDAETLSRARPRTEAMKAVLEAHPDSLDCSVYAYARDGDAIQARMFGALGGIPEDPATGSAAAALGAFLADFEGPLDLTITQGVEMGRPSRIGVSARPGAVTISGQAVRVMEGRLIL